MKVTVLSVFPHERVPSASGTLRISEGYRGVCGSLLGGGEMETIFRNSQLRLSSPWLMKESLQTSAMACELYSKLLKGIFIEGSYKGVLSAVI